MGDSSQNIVQRAKAVARRIVLLFNRLRFRLCFPSFPKTGQYCNSKFITVTRRRSPPAPGRVFLVFVRSGGQCQLIDDGSDRNFDIALNLYACPTGIPPGPHEYLMIGGINKYQAAYQFLDPLVLGSYRGFMFLDDDLEMTYSELSRFLTFCGENGLQLAQPSQSPDSHCSHPHLLNVGGARSRHVEMVEVMCPYFSVDALKTALATFNLSDSTWGLDYLWPKLPGIQPVVVDAFTIRHTKPMHDGGSFYRYMRSIGVSPQAEEKRLRSIPLAAKPACKTAILEIKLGAAPETGNNYEQ